MLILLVSGCQSEIDKCVEAKVVEICSTLFPSMKNPEKGNLKAKGYEKDLCGDFIIRTEGGKIRQECMKAQAGN